MLDDYQYDVLMQLAEESKSLYRIENEYIPEAESVGREDCLDFWEELAADKERHIRDLTELLEAVLE